MHARYTYVHQKLALHLFLIFAKICQKKIIRNEKIHPKVGQMSCIESRKAFISFQSLSWENVNSSYFLINSLQKTFMEDRSKEFLQ